MEAEATERPHHQSDLVHCFWCERIHAGDHPLSICPSCLTKLVTMRLLEMSGSYPLDDDSIDETLTRRSPGNYALGYFDGETFVVFYVGRSDSDVRATLHGWVGKPSAKDRYASAARAPWDVRSTGPRVGAPAVGPVRSGEGWYTRFAYSYAPSAEAAFEKECRNYETFGGSARLDNETPPAA